MPPRLRKLKTKSKDIQPQSQFQIDQKEDEADFEHSVSKLLGKEKKKSKTTKRQKPSTKRKQVSENQDSNSEILEIRHGDQFVRDHVRPDFLRRWDGQSNELNLLDEELKQMSPMFKVYWPIKARNMKAVVFLQFGKMQYFVFENDAILVSEISKKKLKHWSKYLMCNFWCKEVETIKKELFQRKIPVLVMKEIEDPQYRAKYGIVRRQVQQVITPAIHPAYEVKSNSRERLLLALFKEGESFAFVVLDSETNEFLVQQIEEDKYMHEVRRIMNRHRPVQLLIPRDNHDQIGQIAKQISNPHIVQLQLAVKKEGTGLLLTEMAEQTGAPFLKKLKRKQGEQKQAKKEFSRWRTVMALGLVWHYLEDLSLKEKIFNQGLFSDDGQSFRAPFFDSQVYQNLELFRVKIAQDETYCKPGTLLHYVDYCRTQQGRKMLHRWLDCPSTSLQDILERQKAVRELVQNPNALKYHDKMIGYQKLNRKLGDVYHWIARNSEKGKIILTKYVNFQKEYDPRKNPAVVRIREIVEVVNCIKEYEQFLKELGECNFKAPLLSSKIELHDVDNVHTMDWQTFQGIKGLPAIGYVADAVLRSVIYDHVTGSLEPAPGEIEAFDENKKESQRIQRSLQRQLQKWKQFFDTPKIKYVSIRAKNEIEVPKSAIKKDGKTHPHKDLIFSSETAGTVRYTTAQTSVLSEELMEYQIGMAEAYQPFLQQLLIQFSKFRGLWDRYVQSSAWVDALMSLAQASKRMGVRCLPQFRQKGVSIIGATHPSLTQILDKVIANNLILKQEERVLLLTGPNMGGKSTLLKQTCLLVVLAQLGCYVPAVQYSTPVFDQIFCRIGASDRIYEGKSTFYVELEETKLIMNKATSNSLVVIDELGRGTSTYDGMAIAEAVLNNLIENIRAITLFSTHYTQISERFRSNQRVKLTKMGSEINEQSLVFTYQLEEGVAQKSFATNVVRMVGICQQIIKKAEEKSEEMHHQTRRKKMIRDAYTLAKGRSQVVPPFIHSPLRSQKIENQKESNTKASKKVYKQSQV